MIQADLDFRIESFSAASGFDAEVRTKIDGKVEVEGAPFLGWALVSTGWLEAGVWEWNHPDIQPVVLWNDEPAVAFQIARDTCRDNAHCEITVTPS